MTKDSKTSVEVSAVMTKALFVLKDLVDNDAEYEMDYHQVVTLFLQGVISMLCARYTSPPLRQMRSPLYTNFFVSYCHPPF